MALADGALKGFSTPADVFEQRIPSGQDEFPLKWTEEAQERCIVRSVTAHRVSEDPLTKEQYGQDFRKIFNSAGYWKNATIHAVRRALGAVIDGKSSEVTVAWRILIIS